MPRFVRWFGEGSATTALAVGLGGLMVCNGISKIVYAYRTDVRIVEVPVPAPAPESTSEPAAEN
jgi:hypothetical protein